jgi:ABC-type branched-subunit amino acid transport system substrate-binding protein
VLAALAAVTLTTACAGGGNTPSADNAGLDGDPIKIFVTYPGDNPLSPMPEIPDAAKAAVKAINEAGGVKDRPLELIECNNNFDPAQALDCARQAVSDGVVALVGQTDISTLDTLPVLEAGGIPSVGLYSYNNPIDGQSPASYPLNGGSGQAYLALPQVMKDSGLTSLVIQTCEYPSCVTPAADLTTMGPDYGVDVKGTIEVLNAGLPDYSPVATKTKSLDPEAVVQIISFGPSVAAARAAADIGFEPQYIGNQQSMGEREIADGEGLYTGILLSGPFPSPRTQELEISKQYVAERAAYDGVSADQWLEELEMTNASFNEENAWLAVHAFAEAAALIEGDEVTSETLTAVLNDPATSIPLYDLTTWTPGVPGAEPYPRYTNMTNWVMVADDNGQLQTADIEPFDVVPLLEAADLSGQ